MPQLTSPASSQSTSPRQHQEDQQDQQESDNAVTLKNTRPQVKQEERFSEESVTVEDGEHRRV